MQQQKGGDKPNDVEPEFVNRFDDSDMEMYMNPIYGLIYCEIGYIPNIFFLEESEIKNDFIPENHLRIIKKLCMREGVTTIIKPTRDIMNEKVTLTDIGQYIAIKYANMLAGKHEKLKFAKTGKNGYIPGEKILKVINNEKPEIRDKMNKVFKSIPKFTRYIPFEDNDIFVFRMILYCLWWKLGNNDGFDEYYRGIQNVFDILNECFPVLDFVLKEKPVLIPKAQTSLSSSRHSSRHSSNGDSNGDDSLNGFYSSDSSSSDSSSSDSSLSVASIDASATPSSFEQILLDIVLVGFQLYQQEQSLHFCKETYGRYYADCGETTARNIINILCYDGNKFNLEYLIEKGAIKELIDYYEVFNTFQLQSTSHARNAWSKLITEHGQNNINFSEYCNAAKQYGYDMNSGLALNRKKPNLLQLIQNFLQEVDTWDKLKNTNITEISLDLNKDGIGKINIKTSSKKEFTVHLPHGHFFVSTEKKKKKKIKNYEHLETHQKYFIDMLLIMKYNTKENDFLNFNFSSEKLIDTIRENSDQIPLKTLLVQLSLTNKYDSDTRRRIHIDTEDQFFKIFADMVNSNKLIEDKVNDYSFVIPKSENAFKFVSSIKTLKVLNCVKNYEATILNKIDLSPLTQIEHIGDNFLYDYDSLKIDLKHLSNVKTIGSNFLEKCEKIKQIDLSPLKNITTISNYFLNGCLELTEVKFPTNFEHVTYIGINFLSNSPALKTLNLSCFSNVTTIGISFLKESGIETIDLSNLKNLTAIPNEFMHTCRQLLSITFPETLENVKEIGGNFLYESPSLQTIDLSCFSNVTTVGNLFLNNSGIRTIDLSPLKNLTTIPYNFITNCSALKSITFPETFENVKEISVGFLTNAPLQTIDLSSFSNVTNIDVNFLYKTRIETIDLSPLKNITAITAGFLSNCIYLKSITFPDIFEHVKLIDSNFLSKSLSLKTIDLSCFSNVTTIRHSFLKESGIESIDLSPLKSVTRVDDDFMISCIKLKSVIIPRHLKNLETEFKKNIIYTNKSDIGKGKRPTRKLKRTRNLKRKTRKFSK